MTTQKLNNSMSRANPAEINSFLETVRSEGLQNLCAISPNGGRVDGRTFKMPDEIDEAVKWAVDRNESGLNLYWTVNPVKTRVSTKPTKADITAVEILHADIDPDTSDGYMAGRESLLNDTQNRLKNSQYPPSLIVDSGNGLQAFYRLDKPVSDPSVAEDINKQLIQKYGGDTGTYNIDRLMRLPGTWNHSSQRKIDKGYPKDGSPSTVLHQSNQNYSPGQLSAALPKLEPTIKPSKSLAGTFSEDEAPLTEDEIENLNLRIEMLQRTDHAFSARWSGDTAGLNDTSRSGFDMSVMSILKDRDYLYREARHLLTTYEYGAGGEKEANGDERYFRRMWSQISATTNAADVIEMLNNLNSKDPAKAVEIIVDAKLSHSDRDRVINRAVSLEIAGKRPLKADVDKLIATRQRENAATSDSTIIFASHHLPEIVDEVDHMLSQCSPPVAFKRGNGFCKVQSLTPGTVKDIGQPANRSQIATLDATSLIDTATRKFSFYRETKDGLSPVSCPQEVANTFLTRSGQSSLPPLIATVDTPTMRRDGSILDAPGYDSATGLFLTGNDLGPLELPRRLTKKAAKDAVAVLMEPIKDFPFADKASESVAVAAMLTALIRPILPSSPLCLFNATKMATGKSLLASAVSMIATGHQSPAVMSYVENEDEMRKRIFSLFLGGTSIVNMDNISQIIESDSLCIALTEPEFSDRILGKSEVRTVPTTTMFMATGNALRVRGDLSTRSLLCSLDAKTEHPEHRRFDRDLHTWIPAHRKELVTAGLTILSAYQIAGCPINKKVKPWGRFEDWSRYIREPLIWLGMTDPLDSADAIQAFDPVREELGELLELWHQLFRDKPILLKDIVAQTETTLHPNSPDAKRNSALKAMKELLDELLPPNWSTRKFAGYLRRHMGRIEGGHLVQECGKSHNTVLWQVLKAQ